MTAAPELEYGPVDRAPAAGRRAELQVVSVASGLLLLLDAHFLHEEEVPREGLRVMKQYQRTRWRDGRVVVWLGARKVVGRGEGLSGLAFDRIVDVEVPT